jgi:hypothetical protein
MTDQSNHFNPPLEKRLYRKKFANNDREFKNWIRIDLFHMYGDADDDGVSRKRINAAAKKWCVETTHNPWFTFQEEKSNDWMTQRIKFTWEKTRNSHVLLFFSCG